ncbi:MAG TPA: helix-turn-helix transcriptional regulator [Solirubrobacterales bacterium]|nr:helix-turn-helix transcriptional regulator [Solirubrobacterales bacterium]
MIKPSSPQAGAVSERDETSSRSLAPSLASLGAAVRGFRHEKRLTQVQLAERNGLHSTYISQIECGTRNPSFEALTKICRALGVERWVLVRRVDEIDGERLGPAHQLGKAE